MYLAFLLGVLFGVGRLERTNFTLTPENSGFALKDSRFARKKTISVVACAECEIVIDYTVDNCAREGDRQNGIRITCKDELPFTVNDEKVDVDICTRMITLDPAQKAYHYICSKTVKKNVVTLRYLNMTVFNFALGFRARYRTCDSEVLFIPWPKTKSFDKESTQLIIPANTVLVLVADKSNELDVKIDTEDTVFVWNGVHGCSEAEPVMALTGEANVPIENPVISITSNASSPFTVIPQYESAFDSPQFFLAPFFTSLEFAWAFGEPELYTECQHKFFYHLTETHFEFVFSNVSDVRLSLATTSNRTTTIGSDAAFNMTLSRGENLHISWCPQPNATSFGFVLKTHVLDVKEPDRVVHVVLSETFPSIAFGNEMFTDSDYNVRVFDVSTESQVLELIAVELCELLIDQATSELLPVLINNEAQTADCKFTLPLFRNEGIWRCFHLELEASFNLSLSDGVFAPFSISISLSKFVRQNVATFVFPVVAETEPVLYGFEFPAAEQDSYVVLTNMDANFVLQKMRWDRPTKNCTYSLYPGAVPSKNKRKLITYSDVDHFTPQPMSSFLYTLEIPAGCQPSLGLAPAEYFHAAEPVELCAGSAFVMSPLFDTGFGEVFSAQLLPFTLTTLFFCSNDIDVEFELVDSLSGTLSINTYNFDGLHEVENIDLGADSSGNKYTFRLIRNISFMYESKADLDDGFYGRLHAKQRIATRVQQTTATTMLMTSPSANLGFGFFAYALLYKVVH